MSNSWLTLINIIWPCPLTFNLNQGYSKVDQHYSALIDVDPLIKRLWSSLTNNDQSSQVVINLDQDYFPCPGRYLKSLIQGVSPNCININPCYSSVYSVWEYNIVACHLPRGPKLRWCKNMGEELPNVRGPRIGCILQNMYTSYILT